VTVHYSVGLMGKPLCKASGSRLTKSNSMVKVNCSACKSIFNTTMKRG
jgi:hypothetical protein